MPITVFIDGAEGTTGLRLHERLEGRADIELLPIDPALRKDAAERARLANLADIVFLCLPDDAAREAAISITNPTTRIIDPSTAHRTAPGWTYGFPELSPRRRGTIAAARRVANPGCHATGFLSLVCPLIQTGVAATDYPFTCHSVTGYSGAGRKVIEAYRDPARPAEYAEPRQYALGQRHKHLPEMQQVAGLESAPVFNPIIADFYAGMVVTVPLHTRLLKTPLSAKNLHAAFAEYYSASALIRVQPFGAEQSLTGGMMAPAAAAGKDSLEIFVCGHEEQIVLIARFDNLGKGASGAAIQNMNIMCGFDETTGLTV